MLCRHGLTSRAADVGLEGVPEPAIGVLVRRHRGDDCFSRAAVEEVRESAPVDKPGVTPDEVGGCTQIDAHPSNPCSGLRQPGVVIATSQLDRSGDLDVLEIDANLKRAQALRQAVLARAFSALRSQTCFI